MSTGLDVKAAVRALLPLLPRVVGRAKRAPVPAELASFSRRRAGERAPGERDDGPDRGQQGYDGFALAVVEG